MSKHFYYHEMSDKHFDTYEECCDNLFETITNLDLSDWIEENYSKSDLADFILDLAESNYPRGDIEDFIEKIYGAMEQEWIFEDEEEEEADVGKCSTCTFEPNCSRKNEETTDCTKWAWVSLNHNDPFMEDENAI